MLPLFTHSTADRLLKGCRFAAETRLLLIFATSPNETIARSRLQKEIWEDEGIIVGRSPDMFISKLRKKLELDPNINIPVIRGKRYELEINT
ncbi:MAG: winged helix-turn-helix domain-containing protein [Mucilaginibacter sp.]|uniref:winged helix-turn-helix domain-containing protein n=1 Tax=Mucilaginibacter sp. TaxID=1882438 RepID=UPI00326348E7